MKHLHIPKWPGRALLLAVAGICFGGLTAARADVSVNIIDYAFDLPAVDVAVNDPATDTPAVLKAYAERYEYDPRHWSFLTGPEDKIREFARLSGVKADPENGLINHNFRTLIIDATNHLQMIFPMGGDLSDAIVREMRKAAAVAMPVK